MRLHFIVPCICASLAVQVGLADLTVLPDAGGYRVKADAYEAYVAPEGGLTSLKVGAAEFVLTKASIQLGSYFFQGAPIPATAVTKTTEQTVRASSPSGEADYSFGQSSVIIDAKNLTGKDIVYFIILGRASGAVRGPSGTFGAAPTVQTWNDATWFGAKSKLRITGFSKLWGPWDNGSQVVELDIPAKQTVSLTLTPGLADAGELALAAKAAVQVKWTESDINVYSPKPYQVFQRSSLYDGRIVVAGKFRVNVDRVEARVSGESLKGPLSEKWVPVDVVAATGSFKGYVPTQAGGWYKVEVRGMNHGSPVGPYTIAKVGVGEVFVGAGQSNSTNCGQQQTKQTSGMVSSFSGTDWRLADDPQPGCHDNSGGGSFWPAFGDAMYARYKVPIGVAVTGHGGTSASQWQPGGELFNWTLARITQLGIGGFRGVLWHQGESDIGMDSDYYAQLLTNMIVASKQVAGWDFPWFVARVSYMDPVHTSYDSTRNAQKSLWDNRIALEGPDSDTLTGDNRDYDGKGIHMSPKGLLAHGRLWADKVGAYLDKVLGIKQ